MHHLLAVVSETNGTNKNGSMGEGTNALHRRSNAMGFHQQTSSDKAPIYDKHPNERYSVTLGNRF